MGSEAIRDILETKAPEGEPWLKAGFICGD